jgi:hypothetical protein
LQTAAVTPRNTGYTEPVYEATATDPYIGQLSADNAKLVSAQKNLDNVLQAQTESGNYDPAAVKAAQAQVNSAQSQVTKSANALDRSLNTSK